MSSVNLRIVKDVPLGHWRVVDIVLALLHPESSIVTGKTLLNIDGGIESESDHVRGGRGKKVEPPLTGDWKTPLEE